MRKLQKLGIPLRVVLNTTVVAIVTGERRKAKKKQTESKRSYRKKADAVRLCADDLLTRERLVAYHDSYAAAMAKYGLQRWHTRFGGTADQNRLQYSRCLKRHFICALIRLRLACVTPK